MYLAWDYNLTSFDPFRQQLDYAYRHEPDANIRVLGRVRIDNQEAASAAELELHRSRVWAYKWLKRYNNESP